MHYGREGVSRNARADAVTQANAQQETNVLQLGMVMDCASPDVPLLAIALKTRSVLPLATDTGNARVDATTTVNVIKEEIAEPLAMAMECVNDWPSQK